MIFMLLALLLDAYVAATVLDWLLGATRFQISPSARARLRSILEPYLSWVRTQIQPSWNGHDLTHLTAVLILMVVRMALSVLPTR